MKIENDAKKIKIWTEIQVLTKKKNFTDFT